MSAKKVGLTLVGLLLCVGSVGAFWLLLRPRDTTGLVYTTPAGGDPLTLDIDYPLAARGPLPVVVFVPHDPNWHPDFKQEDRIRLAIEVFTRAGYAVATIHYRSPGKTPFPGPIQDGKAAVRFLRANASKYGLAADRIGVMGASAGGYGACMLGTTGPADGFDPPDGPADVSCRVQAVAALAAPVDLTKKTWPDLAEKMYLRPFLGAGYDENPAAYRKASPGTYATPDDPPFLLLHSPSDGVVNIAHSRAFADQLKRGGVEVVLTELSSGVTVHIAKGQELEQTIQQVVPFFDKYLKR
ncbi:alpha/beta hydrolase [Fimbriiglobus ruber]|uniref:Putative lipase/esterase n=1 Tax=Fimbriiglobus ruber TaxID=1908690 RepID=A0A225DGW1_9BACT|nr:alpha/beta hydrolase [Fimbriiglobus ruber]OWK37778.1 putative lipase/esterase [Fimbriiglobus ruber]